MQFKLGQSVTLYHSDGAKVTAKPSFQTGGKSGVAFVTLYTDGGEQLRMLDEVQGVFAMKDGRRLTIDPPSPG